MKSIDEMSVNDMIELYYEKHHALKQNDLIRLLELKSKYPELFDKEKDAQIRDMIAYAKEFQASDRYKELQRMRVKEKLFLITNDNLDES